MPEKRQFRAIKGTRDILPPESSLWNWFEQTAREVFESYNFREIRLPIFEDTELFARSIGVETDVVSKEMYTFEEFESSELTELRTAIITWSYSENYDEFIRFSSWIGRFLVLAREAFDKGEIPRTHDNEFVLSQVEYSRDLMATYRQQGQREFEPRVAHVKDSVRQLRRGDSLTLRPESTASACRAYIEHNMHTLPGNATLYYIGPMFRRE